jgi:ABC-type branched-subunit amino acid transport system ATPase component
MIVLTSNSDAQPVPATSGQEPGRVLMQVNGLRKAFGGQVVLDSVNLELREGEVVLLRGDNGCGKTTLLNILTGNLTPDAGTIHLCANGSEETFRFPRRWWQDLNPADHFLPERVAREGVGRSWQDTRLFATVSLVDNIAVAEPRHPGEIPWNLFFRPKKVRDAEAKVNNEAVALLDALVLHGREQSSADMISLGQTKRVAIARAASAGGKIIFLDEPLAGLDTDGVDAVLNLLRPLAAMNKVTLVIIEHVWNVHHILEFANTVWTLRDGKLMVEFLDSRDRAAVENGPASSRKQLQELTSGLRLVGSVALPCGATLSTYREPDRFGAGELLLDVSRIVVRRGHRSVIGENGEAESNANDGLDFVLRAGDLAILQAPNGWGKTTLFDALAGLLPLTRGTIQLLGHDVTHAPTWKRSRAGLHLLRADKRAFPSLTVTETFALSGSGAAQEALNGLRSQQIGQLSGGEQQSVALTQLAASGKHVYLLDEPFSALDGQHVSATFRAIRDLTSRERTTVLVAMPAVEIAGGVP